MSVVTCKTIGLVIQPIGRIRIHINYPPKQERINLRILAIFFKKKYSVKKKQYNTFYGLCLLSATFLIRVPMALSFKKLQNNRTNEDELIRNS